jgi:NTP pyrophosphatase (non-canonical NTP hydrolase)
MNDIQLIQNKLALFARERDWDQFHSPKNLIMALTSEVGELNEVLQWHTETQCNNLSVKEISSLKEELADVFLYLVRLSDKLEIDLLAEANNKIEKNADKYPVEKSFGNAKKYTEFE